MGNSFSLSLQVLRDKRQVGKALVASYPSTVTSRKTGSAKCGKSGKSGEYCKCEAFEMMQ
jgi:hypothetical protein